MLPKGLFPDTENESSSSFCPPPSKARRVSIFKKKEQEDRLKKPASLISGGPKSLNTLSSFYNPKDETVYLTQCYDSFKFLSNGSYGIASSIRSKDDFKLYALKHSVHQASREVENLFLKEIRRHESVPEHPNLIQLHSAWEEKGYMFIKMELCFNGDLEQRYIKNVPKLFVDEALVWSYLIDALLGLSCLHRNNLIHFDIKPGNMFTTQNEVCKIGDFGLLFNEDKDERESDMDEGDGRYLAFEAFELGPTKPGDIFSLGMSFLELSSIQRLPDSRETHIKNKKICDWFLKDIPQDRIDLIFKMTDKDPANRPTASELLESEVIQKHMNPRHLRVYNHFELNCNDPNIPYIDIYESENQAVEKIETEFCDLFETF